MKRPLWYRHVIASASTAMLYCSLPCFGQVPNTLTTPTSVGGTPASNEFNDSLPDPEPIRPRIPLGHDRVAFLFRLKGVEATRSTSTSRYSVEPTFALIIPQVKNPTIPEIPWVHRAKVQGEYLALQVQLELFSPELQAASQLTIEREEADYLSQLAKEKNGGRPVTVLVEQLPIQKIRLDLRRKTDEEPLGSGEVRVTNLRGNRCELWIRIKPEKLQDLTEAAAEDVLEIIPTYRYRNLPMSKAISKNVANLDLHNRFAQYLKSRHLTGNGDITRADIDKFNREVEGDIYNAIIAETPEAAEILVNQATLISGALVQRAQAMPFAQFAALPQYNKEVLAQHLKPWGYEIVDRKEHSTIDGERKAQTDASQFSAAVSVPIYCVKVGVGYGVSNESLEETYKQTGVRMARDESRQGLRITHIDTYSAVNEKERLRLSQTAEVTVGLPALNGLFGGTSFNPAHTQQSTKDALQKEIEKSRLLRSKLQPLSVLAGLAQSDQDKGLEAYLKSIVDTDAKLSAWESATSAFESNRESRGGIQGRKDGAIQAQDYLFKEHTPMDDSEANGTRDHSNRTFTDPLVKSADVEIPRHDEAVKALQLSAGVSSRELIMAIEELRLGRKSRSTNVAKPAALPTVEELRTITANFESALIEDDLKQLERLLALRPATTDDSIAAMPDKMATAEKEWLDATEKLIAARTGFAAGSERLALLQGKVDGMKRLAGVYLPAVPDADERDTLTRYWQSDPATLQILRLFNRNAGTSPLQPAEAEVLAEVASPQGINKLRANYASLRSDAESKRHALTALINDLQKSQPNSDIDIEIRVAAERLRAHIIQQFAP